MKVPYETDSRTHPTAQPLGYFRGSFPNMQGLLSGLSSMASYLATAEAKTKAKAEQVNRFKATTSLLDFETDAKLRTYEIEKNADPTDLTVPERVANDFDTYGNEFINGLPPELQDEFRTRVAEVGQKLKLTAHANQEERLVGHQKNQIIGAADKAKLEIEADHNSLEFWKQQMDELIDQSDMTQLEKESAKLANAQQLERVAYFQDLKRRKADDADIQKHSQYLISRGAATSEFDIVDSVSKLNPVFATRLSKALQAAEAATGEKAKITDGYRDIERQKKYHDAYLAGSGGLAAAPGRSRHQRGNAADISSGKVLDWLHQHAGEYGLEFLKGNAFAKDPVHIQMSGSAYIAPGSKSSTDFSFKNVTAAMWQVESTNGANVLSPKGAAGITQVMPDTAREIAGKLGDKNFPAGGSDREVQMYLINHPTVSLKYGEFYFNELLAKYGGDTEVALIAYNGGMKRADEFLAAGRDDSVLPTETVEYVDKVYKNMGVPDDIDSNPRYANLPYEDRVALRQDADTAFNAMMKERSDLLKAQTESARNSLYVGLHDGTKFQNDLDLARESGILTDYEDIKKAEDILRKRNEETADLRTFNQRADAGQSFSMTSTDDKKQVNAWFGKSGQDALYKMDQNYVSSTLAPTFAKIGMLPPDAVDILSAQARSHDGAQMKFANNALSILENAHPAAYAAQIDEATRRRADRWEALSHVVPEDRVREIMQEAPTQQERTARIQLLEQAEKEIVDPKFKYTFDSVTNHFDELLSFEPNMPNLKWATLGMENDWRTLMKENYALVGGNWDVANEVTLKELERLWSVSTVGGTKTLMRNPPELVYPDITPEDMTNQLRSELGLNPDETVQLISDETTDIEIAARRKPLSIVERFNPLVKAVRNPTYMVSVEHNGYVHVLVNEKGVPLRYEFQKNPLSSALEEAEARMRQLETQVQLHQTQLMDAVMPNAPEDLTDEIFAKENQLQSATNEYERIKAQMQRSYLTPAQRELEDTQRLIKLFGDRVSTITDATIPENIAKPYAEALDKEAALKKKVEEEIAQRRKYLPR